MSSSNENNVKEEDLDVSPDARTLKRRDTVYEDILGMMVKETEESIKRTMKLQPVLENDERRRLPYQLFRRDLNKVIHEVHFTNGVSNLEKDVKYCQYFNKPTQVPCIGVDKNNLNCGENVILDIDSESTKLPFFCKIMIVNQGRVHERSEPTLVRDVCLQIGESLIEKLFSLHRPNLHNISLNHSYLEPHLHAIEDPNVSFTTPRSHRARRPSWCCMEEYYSIPFYQYRGKEKQSFPIGVNTENNEELPLPIIINDSLHSSLNTTNVNKNDTTNSTKAVDTDDLVDQIKYNDFSKIELLSPYSLNNVKGNDTHDNVENKSPVVPSLTTAIKRKRNKLIHLVFNDQYTNTISIPVTPPSINDEIKTPVVTLRMPGTPRDISIIYDDNDEKIDDAESEFYYVKDATTDTNDIDYNHKLETNKLTSDSNKASDLFKNYTKKKPNTDESNESNDPFKRIRKKYKPIDEPIGDVHGLNSNAFGRILRQRYFKKTTGKDPINFDDFIPYNSLHIDSTPLSVYYEPNNKIISNVQDCEQSESPRGKLYNKSSPRRVNQNDEQNINSPETSEFELNNDNELEKLLADYDRSRKEKMSGMRSHRSKNNSIGDVLSISTIEPGEHNNMMIDANNSCFNNSIDFEQPQQNEYINTKSSKIRGTSAYPDYSRYPLITKALNRSLSSIPRIENDKNNNNSRFNNNVKSSSFILNESNSHNQSHHSVRPSYTIQPKVTLSPDISLKLHRKANNEAIVNKKNNDFCPQCFRDSIRRENEKLENKINTQKLLIEKENVYNNLLVPVTSASEPLIKSNYNHNKHDLEKRIANLIEFENENTRYLLKKFVSPVVSRPETNRSFRISKNKFEYNNNNLIIENPLNNNLVIKQKLKNFKISPIDISNKYYRMRHDKTLKLYKEPIPVDVLKQNFIDYANVTATSAHSLTESGVILKQMNNLIASAEI